jgi:hypothetical protein
MYWVLFIAFSLTPDTRALDNSMMRGSFAYQSDCISAYREVRSGTHRPVYGICIPSYKLSSSEPI